MADTAPLEAADGASGVDEARRFGGLARLYGATGAARIRCAHVVVVGIGGVGSWAAEALARSGVSQLTLIDLDHIAESNINRQIHALDATVGQSKTEAMRQRIAGINPACEVRCIEDFVDGENWPALAGLDGLLRDAAAALASEVARSSGIEDKQIDQASGPAAAVAPVGGNPCVTLAIIDACDSIRAKTAMAAWSLANPPQRRGLTSHYFITAGAAGGKRLAHRVDIDDLALTTHDPLLAQLRYRLRKQSGAARVGNMGVACVFSREAVERPAMLTQAPGAPASAAPDAGLNCNGYGSVVSVTATFGMCAAGWVLDKIAGR